MNIDKAAEETFLDRIQENKKVSSKFLVTYLISFTAYTIAVITLVYRPGCLDGITKLTNGLVQRSLIIYLIAMVIFLYGFLRLYAKIDFRDLGLERKKVTKGIIALIAVIVVVQLISSTLDLLIYKKLVVDRVWFEPGTSTVFGNVISQLFAVAVFEEVTFRGFLLPQVYLRCTSTNSKRKLILAVLISQIIFALWHIPIRIFEGAQVPDILLSVVSLLLIGTIFAFIYIRTNNLFLTIGLHGLWNTKLTIVQSNYYTVILCFVMLLILAFGIGPLQLQKVQDRFPPTARP